MPQRSKLLSISELFPMYFYPIFHPLVQITKDACPTIKYLLFLMEWYFDINRLRSMVYQNIEFCYWWIKFNCRVQMPAPIYFLAVVKCWIILFDFSHFHFHSGTHCEGLTTRTTRNGVASFIYFHLQVIMTIWLSEGRGILFTS